MEDESDDKDDTKRKSRNLSEKKRRDQFNSLVNDLSTLISTKNRKMDKSTVLKSTIAFLKHHNDATDRSKVFEIQQEWKPTFLTNDEFTHLMLESLDGFIIVFNSYGSIFYASESIISLLGYLPCDVVNLSIFDLAYEMEHESLFNIFLNPKPVIEPLQTDINSRNQITFYVHLKRGGIEKTDTNAYELVKFVGYFRNDVNIDNLPIPTTHQHIFQTNCTVNVDRNLIFVGTGRIQIPQLIREISTIDPTRNEFTSKHSMEWKFLFLDHRAPPIIGYMPFEVLGTSGYEYYHFDDLDSIVSCHEKLMQTGEGKSCFYRFLTKGQQWIWLETEFYITYHQYNSKPDFVVCTHKVVSYADVIKHNKSKKASSPTNVKANTAVPNEVPITVNNKTATMTLRDLELGNQCLDSAVPINSDSKIYTKNSIINKPTSTSPTLESASAKWSTSNESGIPKSVSHQTTHKSLHKSSKSASSYGLDKNYSGISSSVKRKRYLHHSSRDCESDSTSMSADSVTSRHSMLTHTSSSRHGTAKSLQNSSQTHSHAVMHNTTSSNSRNKFSPSLERRHRHHHHQHTHMSHQTNIQHNVVQHNQPHMLATLPHTHQVTAQGHLSSPTNQIPIMTSSAPVHQTMLPLVSQHGLGTTQILTNTSLGQFPQSAFPVHSPQILTAPTFLEPPQYFTAIPMQPVIAPFSMTPVLSPMPVNSRATSTPICSIPSSIEIQNQQNDLLTTGAVVMTPTQTQLQDQLQRKHDELQKLIKQQQDELRIVSEQLLLARYTLLQPVMSMNYGSNFPAAAATAGGSSTATGNNRNFSFSTNNVESPFSQYGFNMNMEPMNHHTNNNNRHHNDQNNHNYNSNHISNQSNSLLQHEPSHQQMQLQHQQQQHLMQQQQQHHLQQQLRTQRNHHHNHQHKQQQQQLQQQQQQLRTQHNRHYPTIEISNQHQNIQNNSLLSSRHVPDLEQFGQDDIDAFLNLSPLNSIDSQTSVNQLNTNNIVTIPSSHSNSHNINQTNVTINNNSSNSNDGSTRVDSHSSQLTHQQEDQTQLNNPHQHITAVSTTTPTPVKTTSVEHHHTTSPIVPINTNNDDSLLSYMQMNTEGSTAINFHIGISDEDSSESTYNDMKMLALTTSPTETVQPPPHQHHQQQKSLLPTNNLNTTEQRQHIQQQTTHQQQETPAEGRNNFFSVSPFDAATNDITNDLEILPYQMLQEQPHGIFIQPHVTGATQQ